MTGSMGGNEGVRLAGLAREHLLSLGTVVQLLSLELAVLDLLLQRWTQDSQMSSGKPLSRFVKSSSLLSKGPQIQAPIYPWYCSGAHAVVHQLLCTWHLQCSVVKQQPHADSYSCNALCSSSTAVMCVMVSAGLNLVCWIRHNSPQ